ncbi:hypothetical protein [Streptomyces sp. NPDC057072]
MSHPTAHVTEHAGLARVITAGTHRLIAATSAPVGDSAGKS